MARLTANENPQETMGNGNLPRSFDELASRLNEKFASFAAEIEAMREELRDAEKRSEQFEHRLVDGKLLSSH